MRAIFQIFVLALIALYATCIFPNDREKQREKRRQEKMAELFYDAARKENIDGFEPDTTDFENIKFSEDSLDIKLYELILSSGSFSEDVLLKNIETLIDRGAKPNAMVKTSHSVRKAGSYIPIVKHFYKNKYRQYTKVTSCIHAGVETGNTKIVKKLLDQGGDINIKNPFGTYPIDIALLMNNNKMIDFLIKSGVDLSKADLSNSQNTTLIEKLVKQGANPKTIDINYALDSKQELKRLLVLKPAINELELDFKTLFEDNELLDLLLDNGMSPSVTGKFPDRCPIIFAAIKYDNFKAFKKLHEMGADIHEVCKEGFGDTPLQTSVYYQRIDALNYLLEHKISPNEKDWTKKSVLIMACNTDNDQIINTLVDAGAQIEYAGYFNKTPLLHAVEFDKYISVECLINRKANINFKNKYGMTPLLAAIKKNNYPMIKLLVENGADTGIRFKSMDVVQFAENEEASPAIISYFKKQLKN